MSRLIIITLISFAWASCGSTGGGNSPVPEPAGKKAEKFPIAIDVTKDYPQKLLAYEDLAGISFIPLERTPDNLMNFRYSVFITGADIFVEDKYSVQRFGLDGAFRNKIGRQGRGPGELAQFTGYMVDTTAREVYMFDNGQQKTVVFGYDGILLREFPKADPVYKGGVERFGKASLIVGRQLQAWGNRPMVPGRLFAVISAEDGKEQRQAGPYVSEKNGRKLSSSSREFIRYGDEVIVEHRESDTIYSFCPFRSDSLVFKSRYILGPPGFSDGKTLYDVGVLFETDKYGFLFHVKINSPISDKNVKRKILMADKESGKILEPTLTFEGEPFITYPKSANKDGVAFVVLMPHLVMEWLGKGQIKNPQLKRIAEGLSEDSNPVLMIFRFKNQDG